MAARLVGRVVNPFMDSHNALSFGIALKSTDMGALESDTDEDSSDEEDDVDEEDEDEEKVESRAQKMQQCVAPRHFRSILLADCAARKQEQRERRELAYQFNELLRLVPDLKTDVDLLNNEQLLEYSRYVRNPCALEFLNDALRVARLQHSFCTSG